MLKLSPIILLVGIAAGCSSPSVRAQTGAETKGSQASLAQPPAPTTADSKAAPTNSAAAKIGEAFGLRLGDVFNAKTAVLKTNVTTDLVYRFIPAKPNPLFNEYCVWITPTTKRIYQIWAEGPYRNNADFQALRLAMIQKYGKSEYEGDSGYAARQDGREVICSTYGIRAVNLTYTDRSLARLATEEHLIIKRDALDKTGI